MWRKRELLRAAAGRGNTAAWSRLSCLRVQLRMDKLALVKVLEPKLQLVFKSRRRHCALTWVMCLTDIGKPNKMLLMTLAASSASLSPSAVMCACTCRSCAGWTAPKRA